MAETEDGKKTAVCKVTVEFKTTDQTTIPASSSSGGSSGGGRVVSSGAGSSAAGNVLRTNGAWVKDATGWWYRYADGTYPKASWQQLLYNGRMEWYHFDSRGYMQTGWFTDKDGHIYYLNPVSDGTQGRMFTGWNLIDGKWYYFNTVSDGMKGALFINRTTPDGYRVDAEGVWVQ